MPATNHPMTVLLTAQDPALIGSLQRDLPALDARVIGPELPSHLADGPLYCFVDWLLPEESGLEMVRRLREAAATRHGHITMVLEVADPEDKRRALRAGADDYLLGPLDATHFGVGDVEGWISRLVGPGNVGRGAVVTNRPLFNPTETLR